MSSFQDIPGFQGIKSRIQSSVKHNKLPQTQLFASIDGGAGLAFALALAKFINCESPEDDACNICTSCLQFNSGNSPDLHFSFPFAKTGVLSKSPTCDELINLFKPTVSENPFLTLKTWQEKLESGNKQLIIPVSEAANLISKLASKRFSSKPRVFILWLPELMHTSASNKLLKALEEPGELTYFLLITSAEHKLLDTIKSRCVKTVIPSFSEGQISQELKARGLHAAEADKLAILSEGSLGYALYSLNDSNQREQFGDFFIEWIRGVYSRKVSDLISLSDSFASLNREDEKALIRFISGIFRQGFLLKNQQEVLVFRHKSFDLKRFIPFMNTELMTQINNDIEGLRHGLSRNGNARLLFYDFSLRFFKYIG